MARKRKDDPTPPKVPYALRVEAALLERIKNCSYYVGRNWTTTRIFEEGAALICAQLEAEYNHNKPFPQREEN